MSHITTIAIKITDIEALKAAVKESGAVWLEGQKSYKWYGVSVGDYPLPKGMTTNMLGKCDHVIAVPGVNYQIGVVKLADGSYTLAYDFFGNSGAHDGGKLLAKYGKGLGGLCQLYGVHKAIKEAQAMAVKKGLKIKVNRFNQPDGKIKLSISGFERNTF